MRGFGLRSWCQAAREGTTRAPRGGPSHESSGQELAATAHYSGSCWRAWEQPSCGFGAGSRAEAALLLCLEPPCDPDLPVPLARRFSSELEDGPACRVESEFRQNSQGCLALLQVPVSAVSWPGCSGVEWGRSPTPPSSIPLLPKCGSVHTCTLQNQPAKSLRAHFPK